MNRSEAGRLGYEKTKDLHAANYKARVERYKANPKTCAWCQSPLAYEKRRNDYCSHSCAAIKHNQHNLHNYTTGLYVKKPCVICGTLTKNSKYCSRKCKKQYYWDERAKQIEETGFISTHSKTVKGHLIKQRGYKCEICNISEWLGQRLPLVLDHIDGNADNWSIDNLRLLCSNCDSLTDTYKGKNVGKGRYSRRQRYKEGKSY